MNICRPFIVIVFFLLAAGSCRGKNKPAGQTQLTVFNAGSLAIPFTAVSTRFMQLNPSVKVVHHHGGSRKIIRYLTQLHKEADIIGSSDFRAIEQLMFPRYADWYIGFATNSMVIAYTEKSTLAERINDRNWFEVLLSDEVEFGRGDEQMDPCGYRTLIVWKLAERFYKQEGLFDKLNEKCSSGYIRPKSEDLISLLQAGEIDYAFEYESVARQHHLGYVKLPDEINLSNVEMKDFYSTVSVQIRGFSPGQFQVQRGEPIMYAVTIPLVSRKKRLASKWIRFLLSQEGRSILEEKYHRPILPPYLGGEGKLPMLLRKVVSVGWVKER